MPATPFFSRPIGGLGFVVVALLIAGLMLIVPLPTTSQAGHAWRVHISDAPIVLIGPSTLMYVDKCDRDRRTVAQMLADRSSAHVLDLSQGGQTISDALNVARLTATRPQVRTVIVAIANTYADDPTMPSLRSYMFYSLAQRRPALGGASNLNDFWTGLSGGADGTAHPVDRAFVFDGMAVPNTRTLISTHMAGEFKRMTCPPVAFHDAAFNRTYYWWTNVARGENPALPSLVGHLARDLASNGKRLIVVLLPFNRDLLAGYSPQWSAITVARQARLAVALRRQGAEVHDLAGRFRGAEFAQIYCGCVHLNEAGRRHLTEEIARVSGMGDAS
jgi:hypothetical protein